MSAMNTEAAKVSIIILNDGDATRLSTTLVSFLAQTYEQIECLVALNGNDKSCLELVQANQESIAHYNTISYANKYELVSELLPFATGQYIYVMESGWRLNTPTVIAQMMAGVVISSADVIYGDLVRAFTGKGNSATIAAYTGLVSAESLSKSMIELYATSLIKRELYDRVPFFTLSLAYNVGWFFVFRLLVQAKAVFLHQKVELVSVPVGRHGRLGILSTANLAQNERVTLLKEYFPEQAATLLAYLYPDGAGSLGIKHSLVNLVGAAKSGAKRVVRSIRSRLELYSYKRKYQAASFSIPIIINNKNHLTYLLRLINSLEKRGYTNIYIIDNNSTYQPLLDFYKKTDYKVFLLGENVGFCALWDTDIFAQFEGQYYVYTDSDLELVDECPTDFMVVMRYLLDKYSLGKVGLSLPIDDLPNHFAKRAEVQKWERAFNTEKVERLAYNARVDTTFALYKPDAFGDATTLLGFRTRFPYSARHLPWYENTAALTEEQQYYYANVSSSTHWSKMVTSTK